MKTMTVKKYIYIFLLGVFVCSMTACKIENTSIIESKIKTKLEFNIEIPSIEITYGEQVVEAEKKYIYQGENAVLAEDNFVETMEELLCIKNEWGLSKLETLPLTEKFFNQCIEDYQYINNIEEMKDFQVEFWGMNEEGTWICLCKFKRSERLIDEQSDTYYVEVEVIENQIDDLTIFLVEEYREY